MRARPNSPNAHTTSVARPRVMFATVSDVATSRRSKVTLCDAPIASEDTVTAHSERRNTETASP